MIESDIHCPTCLLRIRTGQPAAYAVSRRPMQGARNRSIPCCPAGSSGRAEAGRHHLLAPSLIRENRVQKTAKSDVESSPSMPHQIYRSVNSPGVKSSPEPCGHILRRAFSARFWPEVSPKSPLSWKNRLFTLSLEEMGRPHFQRQHGQPEPLCSCSSGYPSGTEPPGGSPEP